MQARPPLPSAGDYSRHPAEDFARASVSYVDEQGAPLVVEATTSWSFVGAGLRLTFELLGPEYSMSISTLDAGTKIFFSRRLQGPAGEDLVEKQYAEQGLMPLVGNETAEYGYEAENRFFTRCFLDGIQPDQDFRAGLEVTELLMTCYMIKKKADYLPRARRRMTVWEALEFLDTLVDDGDPDTA